MALRPRRPSRTVPFGLLCMSLVDCWYARYGQPALDAATPAPWYRTKHAVSFADMLTALRRRSSPPNSNQVSRSRPPPAEILQLQQAWTAAAARDAKPENH